MAHLVVRPHDDGEKSFWTHPVSRRWDETDGRPMEVLCFSNGEELGLSHGGERVPLERDEQNGYWVGVTTSRQADLVLETRRAGRVVACDILRPKGDAVRMDAIVWKAPAGVIDRCFRSGLAADGVVQIECTLLDEHGEVARDERVVSAVVEGGALLGLENGDLGDNAPYALNHRRTLDGRLIVFVRPDELATVTLSSPGLPDVRMECRS